MKHLFADIKSLKLKKKEEKGLFLCAKYYSSTGLIYLQFLDKMDFMDP